MFKKDFHKFMGYLFIMLSVFLENFSDGKLNLSWSLQSAKYCFVDHVNSENMLNFTKENDWAQTVFASPEFGLR